MATWLTRSSSTQSAWPRGTFSISDTFKAVQRLAEQGEQLRGALEQSLAEQGEQLRQQAQRLSEQGEAAFRASADKISELGLTSPNASCADDEEYQEEKLEDLVRRFEGEAIAATTSYPQRCRMENASTEGGPVAGSEEVQLVVGAMRCWKSRLCTAASLDALCFNTLQMRALLRSKALLASLAALARTEAGRDALRAAAGEAMPVGQAEPGPEEEPGEAGEAGRLLWWLLERASSSPRALLAQLLNLLANVAEEEACAWEDELAAAAKSATGLTATAASGATGIDDGAGRCDRDQDVRWALELFASSLLDATEVALNDRSDLERSIDNALEQLASATKTAPDKSDARSNEPQGEKIATGEGRSGIAQAVTVPPKPGDEIWAVWLGDGCYYRARVLRLTEAGRVEVAWLRSSESRDSEDDSSESDSNAGEFLGDASGDDTLISRLDPAHKIVPANQPKPVPAVQAAEEEWGQQLEAAEAGGRLFSSLNCIRQELAGQHSSPDSLSAACVCATAPLAAAQKTLATLRSNGERRAGALAGAASECSDTGKSFEDQLASSARSFEVELQGISRKRESLRREIEADLNERQVRANAGRVSLQLQNEVSKGEEVSRRVSQRQQLLTESGAVSRRVETLLASRAEKVVAQVTCRENIAERQPEITSACLEAERCCARHLDELLRCWKTTCRGSNAEELVRDPVRLSAIRALHARACVIVDDLLHDARQLAEEESAETSQIVVSTLREGLLSAAERYANIRQELQANLDELSMLESQYVAPAIKPWPLSAALERRSSSPPATPVPTCVASAAAAFSTPLSPSNAACDGI